MSTSNSVNKKIRTIRTTEQINQIINKVEKMTINKKVSQMPEDSAFMTNEKIYPKPMVKLADAKTTKETKEKFDRLLAQFDDIVSKHSSNIGKPPLETMTIDVKPGSMPAASQPYNTALKNQD